MTDLDICFAGLKVVLTPEGGLYSTEDSHLFVSDLHLGKDGDFRRAGVGVPVGSDESCLSKLDVLIDRLGARNLVVLGDVWHSLAASKGHARRELESWIARRPTVHMKVVLGNHDYGSEAILGAQMLDESDQVGDFTICHKPPDEPSEPTLCGHVHPVVRFGPHRLRCFWLAKSKIVLPAFGGFTGGFAVDDQPGRKFALTPSRVVEIP